MTTSFPPINYPNKPVPPFSAPAPRNPFPGFYPDLWKNITGKPYITVSSKGLANGLSEYFNDGADFGPDSLQADGSLTQTSGIQEACAYINSLPYSPLSSAHPSILLTAGRFIINATVNMGLNLSSGKEIPPLFGVGRHQSILWFNGGDGLTFPPGYVEDWTMAFLGLDCDAGSTATHYINYDITNGVNPDIHLYSIYIGNDFNGFSGTYAIYFNASNVSDLLDLILVDVYDNFKLPNSTATNVVYINHCNVTASACRTATNWTIIDSYMSFDGLMRTAPPYFANTNSIIKIASNAVYTPGTSYVSPTPTIPANPPVSGTVYQNTNPYDIEIDLPVYRTTAGTAGYVTIAKGATSTPTAIGNQFVSGSTSSTSTDIIKLRVPAGWYYSFTGSGVTFTTATPFAE